jgi:hypothetical protein
LRFALRDFFNDVGIKEEDNIKCFQKLKIVLDKLNSNIGTAEA